MLRTNFEFRISSFVFLSRPAWACALCFLLLLTACKRSVEMRPLIEAGMEFRTTDQLKEMNVTEAEVAELVKLKSARFTDAGCLELMRLARERKQPLAADEVVSLLRAGFREDTIREFARLNALGLWAGEAQLMRYAGISEETILMLARRRAQSLPTASGASLVQLKNRGISESTVRTLAERGITDADADTIATLRRRGVSEREILRRFPGH